MFNEILLNTLWAFSWRIVFLFFVFSIMEHQMHVWILHTKGFLKFPYRKHHVEHHGQKKNVFRSHIDLDLSDYFIFIAILPWLLYRSVYVNPYGWVGIGLTFFACLAHKYTWDSLHRAFHREHDHLFSPSQLLSATKVDRGERLQDTWMTRQWWFPIYEKHHLLHHAYPNKNYSVVFIWTDRLFRTKLKEHNIGRQ